jgi:magnesium-transporting ATPase (P-type)
MVTSTPPAIGLGLEKADDDVMERPPHQKSSLFTFEVILDMLFYGIVAGGLALGAFVFVIYVYGSSHIALFGGIPSDCNRITLVSASGAPGEIPITATDNSCYYVYRARGTSFVTLNLLILIHAFSCKNQRKSLLRINIRDNLTLFWIGTCRAIHVT